MATTRIYERTVVAGQRLQTDHGKLVALMKAQGGRVVHESDKGIVLEFPSSRAAEAYEHGARKLGAVFDAMPEGV